MNEPLIIDTDILIDIARNDKVAKERISREEKRYILSISSITEMELIIGCQNKREIKIVDKFIQGFEIINLDYEITRKAIILLKEYRHSYGLLIADSLIASTCIIKNHPLLTKNQKHFKYIKGLKLLTYP